jgi:hypothetical protein
MSDSFCFVDILWEILKRIEHSCMGEFRDMGIPAQVVKKKSCTSGEACAGIQIPAHVQELYSIKPFLHRRHDVYSS